MMDLFPEVEEEEKIKNQEIKIEDSADEDDDSIGLDACRDATDITSLEAMEELASLNPNLLLPYVLPLNKKYTDTRESVSEIFNKKGLQFMHIQMPSTLPSLNKKMEAGDTSKNVQETGKKVYHSSKLECLPSGKLGKLRVHKSGKIKLHIDGHEFNFFEGNGSMCKQQVCCHLEHNKEFLFLGNFHNRFVVSPDLSEIDSNNNT